MSFGSNHELPSKRGDKVRTVPAPHVYQQFKPSSIWISELRQPLATILDCIGKRILCLRENRSQLPVFSMQYTIEELRNVCLWPGGIQAYPTEDMDEVHPGIFLGNAASAFDIDKLLKLNIGYVLNAAHGRDSSLNLLQVHPEEVYLRAGIIYCGIPAIDMMSYPLDNHFRESTDFIRQALKSGKGVLVHCRMGISRSAALVIAYLVEAEEKDVKDATRMVRQRREICPNDGFLQQLCNLKSKME